MTLLVGALTGQHELSEADQQAVGEWIVDHANKSRSPRSSDQDSEDSDWRYFPEFRVKVAEAIRDKTCQPAPTDGETNQDR